MITNCNTNIRQTRNKDDCINLLTLEKQLIIPERDKRYCYKCIDIKLSNNRYSLYSSNPYSIEGIKEGIKENYIYNKRDFINYLKSKGILLIDKLELRINSNTGSFISNKYKKFIEDLSTLVSKYKTLEDTDTQFVYYTGPTYNTCRPCGSIKREITYPEYEYLQGKSSCIKLIIDNKEKYYLSRDRVLDLKEIDKYLIEVSIYKENELLNSLKKKFNLDIYNYKEVDYSWIR